MKNKNDNLKKPNKKEINLTEFLERNSKILEVLGVFLALTAIFIVNKEKIGYIISAITFSICILILSELYINIAKNNSKRMDSNLRFFVILITLLFFSFISFFFVSYMDLVLFLTGITFVTITMILPYLVFNFFVEKYNIKLFKKSNMVFSYFISIILIIIYYLYFILIQNIFMQQIIFLVNQFKSLFL